MLKRHGLYPYTPIRGRPGFTWPGGAKLACFIAVNVEVFPFAEGLWPELAPRQPEPDVVNFSWRDYGNRVGIWRMLELFDDLDLPSTALMNTALYDECPEIPAALRARGDEIAGHGRTNAERQSDMTPDEERAMIHACVERITREEGKPPAGWMGPWVSETHATLPILVEEGFRYVMDWAPDDQPVWFTTPAGRILSMPYARQTNDLPQLHGAKLTPWDYARVLIDQFDEMLEQAERPDAPPLVYSLSLHPFLIGQPYRLRHLRTALSHIARHRDRCWIAPAGDIASYCADLPSGLLP